MANEEQLKRLLAGVEGRNKWRNANPLVKIDLSGANLKGANLFGFYLSYNDFQGKLYDGNPQGVNLEDANLKGINLEGANLDRANFERANLEKANLIGANLYLANLNGTNLVKADLGGANLRSAHLSNANLLGAVLATLFEDIDLSETIGLDNVQIEGPTSINTGTLELSKGKIPAEFLRACGLSDWEIESAKLYQPGLTSNEVNDIVYRIYDLRANKPIQINRLFISYSHKDSAYIDAIEKVLNEKGIRFWRDIHHATAGKLEKIVDRAMRLNPIVLLVLSKDSVMSDWVEHEARSARELEKELGRDVLCPVALDDAWKDCAWPARLREQIMEYNILDFSRWKDEGEFGKMFRKLIDGLDLFYKEG